MSRWAIEYRLDETREWRRPDRVDGEIVSRREAGNVAGGFLAQAAKENLFPQVRLVKLA
jgi:hypothetical protein